MSQRVSSGVALAATAILAGGCACGPMTPPPDAGNSEVDAGPGRVRPDAGPIYVIVEDAGPGDPPLNAGEACPPEAFGRYELDDGGIEEVPEGALVFGLCGVTRRLTGAALLNDAPVNGLVRMQFVGGMFQSDIEKRPDPFGRMAVRVLRNKYDQLKYEPGTVFATHRGYLDFGPIDLRVDQERRLEARKHTLAGSVLYGGVPFRSMRVPPDLRFEAYGTPQQQEVETSSNSGSYQVDLLEGSFALFLTSPWQALQGTELARYQINLNNLNFTQNSLLDIDLPARVIEGAITFDGQPIPDRLPGPDFRLEYVKPGDPQETVRTYHEGGINSLAAVVPAGRYAVNFNLLASPDRRYPSEMFGFQVTSSLDLNQNQTVRHDFEFVNIEGSLAIDGQPVRIWPNASWKMFMYGFASSSSNGNGLIYEIPLDTPVFNLKAPRNDYFTVIFMDDTLADDLPTGFYVVDDRVLVRGNTRLPINIETTYLTGRLLIDGHPPPAGETAGRFFFRNRLTGPNQNSIYWRFARTTEDGSFRVRLPKGEYEVFFEIDEDTYPEYASGRQTVVPRVILNEAQDVEISYETTLVTGPIRLDRAVVPDILAGADVGLVMRRNDGRDFVWGFEGGKPNYRLRVPTGRYMLDFVINRGAIDADTAWGKAPMGINMGVGVPPDDMIIGR